MQIPPASGRSPPRKIISRRSKHGHPDSPQLKEAEAEGGRFESREGSVR